MLRSAPSYSPRCDARLPRAGTDGSAYKLSPPPPPPRACFVCCEEPRRVKEEKRRRLLLSTPSKSANERISRFSPLSARTAEGRALATPTALKCLSTWTGPRNNDRFFFFCFLFFSRDAPSGELSTTIYIEVGVQQYFFSIQLYL